MRSSGRASVAAYAHAKFLDATVSNIERTSAADQPLLFTITLADGTAVHGRRVVLATGEIICICYCMDELAGIDKQGWCVSRRA